MDDLTGDPRCNFCKHLASSHTYEASADLSVPCAACAGGRCPPAEPRTGEWAQDVGDGQPTIRAGSVITMTDPG